MTRILSLTLTLLCAVTCWLALSGTAQAASAASYGSWYADPGSGASNSSYRVDTGAFNDDATAAGREIQTYACAYPRQLYTGENVNVDPSLIGVPLSDTEQGWLKDTLLIATQVYAWNGKDDEDSEGLYKYRGANPGERMQNFVSDVQYLTVNGGQMPAAALADDDSKETLQQLDNEGDKDEDGLKARVATLPGDPSGLRRSTLSKLLNPTASPSALTANIPDGCALSPLASQAKLGFSEFFKNPTQWLTNLVFAFVGAPTNALYSATGSYAFKFAFWTPHTERGDTILNVATSCAPGDNGQRSAEQKDSCSANNTPLGFNKSGLDLDSQDAWYLNLSIFLQWLLSGFYFILLFAGALVFMFTTRAPAAFNVMQMMPRMFLSALLTLFAPFAIGICISLSNFLVEAMFSSAINGSASRSVGQVHDIMLAMTSYASNSGTSLVRGGVVDDLALRSISLVTGTFATFWFVVLLVSAVVRQLVLIGLIVTVPLACFAIISPKWMPKASMWLRFFMATLATPVILALILRIGTSLNPLLGNDSPTFLTFMMGAFLLILTLWFMGRTVKLGWAFARGGDVSGSMTGRALSGVSGLASTAALGAGNPALAGALRLGSGLAAAGAGASAAGSAATASLVPQGRGMMSAGGRPTPTLSEAVGKVRASAGAGRAPGAGGRAGGAGGGIAGLLGAGAAGGGAVAGGGAIQRKFAQHVEKRMNSQGLRRVSSYSASRMRQSEAEYDTTREGHNNRAGQIEDMRDDAFRQHLESTGVSPSSLDAQQYEEQQQRFLHEGVPMVDADGKPVTETSVVRDDDGTEREVQVPVLSRPYEDTLREHLLGAAPLREHFSSDKDFASAESDYGKRWDAMSTPMGEYKDTHDHLVERGGNFYIQTALDETREREEQREQMSQDLGAAPAAAPRRTQVPRRPANPAPTAPAAAAPTQPLRTPATAGSESLDAERASSAPTSEMPRE